ncbi:hypothetical protein ABTM76_19220, partial [Acinetobacter baumannii]
NPYHRPPGSSEGGEFCSPDEAEADVHAGPVPARPRADNDSAATDGDSGDSVVPDRRGGLPRDHQSFSTDEPGLVEIAAAKTEIARALAGKKAV